MHDRLYFKLQQADSRTNFLQETFAGCVISSISSSMCLHLLLLLLHLLLHHPLTTEIWCSWTWCQTAPFSPSWLSFIMSILFDLIFLSISICNWHSLLPLFQSIPLSLPLRCSSLSCSGVYFPSVSLTRFILCSNYNTHMSGSTTFHQLASLLICVEKGDKKVRENMCMSVCARVCVSAIRIATRYNQKGE